jgi:hypothetical protein
MRQNPLYIRKNDCRFQKLPPVLSPIETKNPYKLIPVRVLSKIDAVGGGITPTFFRLSYFASKPYQYY